MSPGRTYSIHWIPAYFGTNRWFFVTCKFCYVLSSVLKGLETTLTNNYLFKINDWNAKKKCEICSNLTVKTLGRLWSHKCFVWCNNVLSVGRLWSGKCFVRCNNVLSVTFLMLTKLPTQINFNHRFRQANKVYNLILHIAVHQKCFTK